MSAGSTTSPLLSRDKDKGGLDSKPPIVIVRPTDQSLNYSNPPNPNTTSPFDHKDAKELKSRDLLTIWNSTEIRYNFTGTGILVVAMTHQQFPPIPTDYLPQWHCSVDGKPTDNSNMHLHHHDTPSDIPTDSKAGVCGTKNLSPGPHTLNINLNITRLPAFFHSIRYRPLLNETNNGSLGLHDVFLRIDSQDTSSINFDPKSWKHDRDGYLKSDPHAPGGYLSITYGGNGNDLKWYGDIDDFPDQGKHDNTIPSLDVILDGDYIPTNISKHDFFQPLFNMSSNRTLPSHTLTVLSPRYELKLDHLLVTLGHPKLLDSIGPQVGGSLSMPPPTSKPVPAGSIIGGVLGSLLILLIIFFVIKYIRRRQQRNTWKDSTLPSAITYPASRVSSRSSFSREVVTGDIEYNPEAQKKLDGAFSAGVMEPQPAVILHADSGIRILRASEVPPHYTRI